MINNQAISAALLSAFQPCKVQKAEKEIGVENRKFRRIYCTLVFISLIAPVLSFSQLPDVGFKKIVNNMSGVWTGAGEDDCPTVTFENGALIIKTNSCGVGSANLAVETNLAPNTRIRVKFSYYIHGSDKVTLRASFGLATECLPYSPQFLRREPELHSQVDFKKENQKKTIVLDLFWGGLNAGPGQLTVPAHCTKGELMGMFALDGNEMGSEVELSDVLIQTY